MQIKIIHPISCKLLRSMTQATTGPVGNNQLRKKCPAQNMPVKKGKDAPNNAAVISTEMLQSMYERKDEQHKNKNVHDHLPSAVPTSKQRPAK
jgi:hypothetical protein